jgi:ribonuclease P protein component
VLKREFRLRKKSEFAEMREKGRRLSSSLFGLVYLKSNETKFGWIISKKISKKAVDRNKIRRRLAEVVKNNWIDGYKILFLVRSEIVDKKLIEIESEWKKLMEVLKR